MSATVWYVVLAGDDGREIGAYRDEDDAWAAKRRYDELGYRNRARVLVDVVSDAGVE